MNVLDGYVGVATRRRRAVATLAAALVAAALAFLASDGADAAERARLVRYVGILVSAALAIGAQHALYPSPHARRLQLGNPDGARLLALQLGRWLPVPLVLAVPALVLAGGDALLAIEGMVGVVALGLYAFARASRLGERVEAWERGEAGVWYQAMQRTIPATRGVFVVPDALVPGLLLTGEVFLVGSVLSIAGRALGTGWAALGAPAALAGLALVLVARQRGAFDRAFWASHGVWADAFRQVENGDGREPVAYDAVYWAPPSLRPAVWAGLVALDRRFPLGRVAAVALAIVAIVHLADAGPGVEAATLALTVLGLNGAIALAVGPDVAPPARVWRLGGIGKWTAVRALMNARWLVPLVVVLLAMVWLTDDVSFAYVGVWASVDIAIAVLSAGLVTVASHLRFRRAVA
ncbi:hypothetical protein [Rubrivirga sp. IMCC45206]|uniref:hypothetical protein n=1 Tax=Rubrivirga sp. IMCC45206 TaxID=3391614 RepID=UPI00398FBF38